MNKLLMALAFQALAGVLAFFQLQGWVVWDKPWLKSMWWVYGTSVLIAPLFFY